MLCWRNCIIFMTRKTKLYFQYARKNNLFSVHSSSNAKITYSYASPSRLMHRSVERCRALDISVTSVSAKATEVLKQEQLLSDKNNDDIKNEEEFDDYDDDGDVDDHYHNRKDLEASKIKTDELFQELSNGDDKILNDLKLIQMNIDMASCSLHVFPKLDKDMWINLLGSSPVEKVKILKNIFFEEIMRMRTMKLKQGRQLKRELRQKENADNPYGLFKKSLFMRINQDCLKNIYSTKVFGAMMYSEELFIDCSYKDYMSPNEVKFLAKQIIDTIRLNNMHVEPFKLVFCNLAENDPLRDFLCKFNPQFFSESSPYIVHEGSYLEMYPKKKFVYLSPHSQTYLDKYDPNVRYIIGAYVDKNVCIPISLAKSKELNLMTAKFPIEKYLDWGIGKKTFPINHCAQIMLDLRHKDNDWLQAFEVIPKRFLLRPEVRTLFSQSKKNSIRDRLNSAISYKNFM